MLPNHVGDAHCFFHRCIKPRSVICPRDRGRAPAADILRCPAGGRKPRGLGTGARSARGLTKRGREGEPWQGWRTTPPLRPGEASAAQGSRNAVDGLVSTLARSASRGRPSGVIAGPQGSVGFDASVVIGEQHADDGPAAFAAEAFRGHTDGAVLWGVVAGEEPA